MCGKRKWRERIWILNETIVWIGYLIGEIGIDVDWIFSLKTKWSETIWMGNFALEWRFVFDLIICKNCCLDLKSDIRFGTLISSSLSFLFHTTKHVKRRRRGFRSINFLRPTCNQLSEHRWLYAVRKSSFRSRKSGSNSNKFERK